MTSDVSSEISILGKKVSYSVETVEINRLKFYERNPRVLSNLIQSQSLNGTEDERQQAIFEGLKNEASVKKLLETIPPHKGIIEPLIVSIPSFEVLEGNSRLAALRILYEKDQDEMYISAPCRIISGLKDEDIDALLYVQHVDGKTEWSAYDKAYSAYHRIVIDKVPIDEYAKRTSTTSADIKKQIEIIQLMHDQGAQSLTSRFSYYAEMVRSSKLGKAFEQSPGLEEYILNELKENEPSFTALELRDKIPQIAKKPKILKKLIKGKLDFDGAVESSKVSEPKQLISRYIDRLKGILNHDLEKMDKNDLQALKQEIRKCTRELERMMDLVSKSLEENGK